MSTAAPFSSFLPKSRRNRRPKVKVNRRAKKVLSRDRRWKKREETSFLKMLLSMLAGVGIAAVVWTLFFADHAGDAEVIIFPEFVAEVEATFPEAIQGYTRAKAGTLSNGQEVPVAVAMLLPAHALESAEASADALTRLSAPFVGRQRAISGAEIGNRIARLAGTALPEGVSSCYTYTTKTPRRITISADRTLFAMPLVIAFNPEC